jgi:hypothetical protein
MSILTLCSNLNSLERSLTRLLSDIQDFRAGEMLCPETLSDAPVIDQWSYGLVQARCIVGSIREHPILGKQARVHTSQLVFIDPENGWARTWSRYYRLGTPETLGTASESV